MVITFLAFSRRLFTLSICPHLHLTELTVHVTCQHASTNCTTTVNISALNTDATCPSDTPVCNYKYVWYHNTMPTNRIYYKPDKVSLTLRRLMSYIYGAPILDVSRSHTTTQHSR